MMKKIFLFAVVLLGLSCSKPQQVEVLIIGGGASGTTAGIQAARMGVNTLVVEEYEWLGGALTSAGVSAIDGCYRLPSGLFGEFRKKLLEYYGHEDEMRTGWVAALSAEPSVMDKVLKKLAANEKHLDIWYRSTVDAITKKGGSWLVTINREGVTQTVRANVLIDGTELGDVAKMCGAGYDIGMEARDKYGESVAPERGNTIIQDITYVAIVKDYGYDVTLPEPEGYDPSLFYCACQVPECTHPREGVHLWSCEQMLTYGKLPNNKYMLNWPIEGNDYYLNLVEKTPEERKEALKEAKHMTLCYLYYLQTALGFRTIGLADDEYPTEDLLPFIPYNRESRRIHGLVRFTLNDLAEPYNQPTQLYRTCIAVGDYPVDHHHSRYQGEEKLPDLSFHPVPSFGLPMGTLLPKDVENLIVTEKSISVSNLTNGTSRVQPVLMQIGQAAGVVAALSVRQDKKTAEVSVRDVQKELLKAGGYLLPYLDLPAEHSHFKALQRIGSTGILHGRGVTSGWANETWFDADSTLRAEALLPNLAGFYPGFKSGLTGVITVKQAIRLLFGLMENREIETGATDADQFISRIVAQWPDMGLTNPDLQRNITRMEFAVLLDVLINPFDAVEVDINGTII